MFKININQTTINMPRKGLSNRKSRRPAKRVARRNRRLRRPAIAQRFTVHRRLVVYPKKTSATWLDKLAWFGSVALKLFQLISNVTDDLKAITVTIASGATILLGPLDFAAVCPAAASVYTSTDREVQALRSLPYERASLPSLSVRIVPAIDVASRSGMYAAVLIPCDEVAQAISRDKVPANRFIADYDNIIKHPNAVLAPATRSITLRLNRFRPPHNILPYWTEADGYQNLYPTYALLIGFSSLAAPSTSVEDEYAVGRALFEVHLTGHLVLSEPGTVSVSMEKPGEYDSYCTNKISSTDVSKYAVRVGDRYYDVDDGSDLDLTQLPLQEGKRILAAVDRMDLLPKLRAQRLTLGDMELE